MSDVFVSYKAEDRKRVKPLVEALQAEGFSVWWDEQIGGGAAWRQAIEAELNAAKCVIVVWSTRSVGADGTFVQDEATRAQQRHVYVPVLIDKVHLPLGFGETQALPLTGWHGNRSDPRYDAVLAAVRRNVGGKRRSAPSLRLPQAKVDRRTMIGGGAVAAVAVAGVGGWALLRPSSAGAASGSIAVLPFQNLSGDPAQAYFSDGIAEEIRSALARLGGLEVAGSTSSEAVRNEDAQSAAKKLSVANILTGSVRQSPSTIRISAELIDGHTGLDKWSQDYDRSPGDAIKIQTDIAQNVATALSATLERSATAVVTIGATTNPAAQDLFLKAKAQTKSDDSEASLRKAIGLYDSAITLDPKFALAYALKAEALADLNGYYTQSNGSFAPGYVQAESVARQAISLAPNLAAGHNVLAYIFESQLNVGAAAAEYERGHSLAAGDIDALLGYASFLTLIGRTSEAKAIAKNAEARDPLNPKAFAVEGKALEIERRFDDSIAVYRKVMALAPSRLINRAQIGFMLSELGKNDEALANLRALPPDHLFRLLGEAVINARAGNLAASDAALQRLRQLNGDAANYQYAEIYAQRGAKEQAFASLDRAWKFQDPGLPYMATDLWLSPLRSDPRFGAYLQKMNFPAA
jgi:serine/threonine-protein kinase